MSGSIELISEGTGVDDDGQLVGPMAVPADVGAVALYSDAEPESREARTTRRCIFAPLDLRGEPVVELALDFFIPDHLMHGAEPGSIARQLAARRMAQVHGLDRAHPAELEQTYEYVRALGHAP